MFPFTPHPSQQAWNSLSSLWANGCARTGKCRRGSIAGRAARRYALWRRAEIGVYIANVVANWDATTLVNRMELQVGRDLQYIRINGTLVGGLFGLIIFVASKWLAPI